MEITEKYHGMRLDKVLLDSQSGASFGLIQKLCRKGQIRLDGKRCKAGSKVAAGMVVKIPRVLTIKPADRPVVDYRLSSADQALITAAVLCQNDDIIAINKPYGLPVQAGSGHSRSLDRMMVAFLEGQATPKLLHRLDKTTTGCVLFAKNKPAATRFSKAFKTRDVTKTYWTLVQGKLKEKTGKISGSLIKNDAGVYEKMTVDDRGKAAETSYHWIVSAGNIHWLAVTPKTGRTHQIRAHLASIGVPIIGDTKYGGQRLTQNLEDIAKHKMFLHARRIELTSEAVDISAPLPDHFEKVFKLFEWHVDDAAL